MTSNCEFGECDGSGYIREIDETGISRARICRCAKVRSLMAASDIPAEFRGATVSSFETDVYNGGEARKAARNVKKIAIQYVKRFPEMRELGKGLYLYSAARGSGKTRLAASIGGAIITRHVTAVRFMTCVGLLDAIKGTFDNKTGETKTDILNRAKEIAVLILDDIGTEKPSAFVGETLYGVVNERMSAKRVTIFTSNCQIEDLRHDDRIISRIQKMALSVSFPEQSIRAELASRENEEILRSLLEG